MSWNVMFVGNPDNVINALEVYGEKLSGTSLSEFQAALPYITGIIKLNTNGGPKHPVLKLNANGHAYAGDYSTCSVSIETLQSELV